MPETKLCKITCEIVVGKADAGTARRQLATALATIAETCTIFWQGTTEFSATRPDHAANNPLEMER
jgi:hypothetical protein